MNSIFYHVVVEGIFHINCHDLLPFPHVSLKLWAVQHLIWCFNYKFHLGTSVWAMCACSCERAWNCNWNKTVLCLRAAETGRGCADRWKGHVTAKCDYHKVCVHVWERVCVYKRPSSLSLYTSAAFPLTHGTQIKRLKQRWKTLLWIKPSTSSWDLCAKHLCAEPPLRRETGLH